MSKAFQQFKDNPNVSFLDSVSGEPMINTSATLTNADGASVAILERTTGTEQPAVTDDALVVYDVGGGVASVSSEYRATTSGKGDGTAVYASGTTLTLAGLPITLASEDIVYIREVDATGNTASIWVNGAAGIHMEYTAGTLTRSGGTDFSATGVYEVGYNGQKKAYDSSLGTDKIIEQSPLWSRYTDASADLLAGTPYEITASFADVGAEIEMKGYNQLGLWGTLDIGTSINTQIRILFKHTSAGAEEYRQVSIDVGSPSSTQTSVHYNDYLVTPNADGLFFLPIEVGNVIPYIQIQIKDDANGDGQIDALYVTKAWSPSL